MLDAFSKRRWQLSTLECKSLHIFICYIMIYINIKHVIILTILKFRGVYISFPREETEIDLGLDYTGAKMFNVGFV